MKHTLLLMGLSVLPAMVQASSINISATDPFVNGDNCNSNIPGCDVIGPRSGFDIQKATVTYDSVHNHVIANLYFNFNNLGASSLSPFQDGNVILNVGDLLFSEGGNVLFAVPLANHAGSPNGGANDHQDLEAGDLYKINNQQTGLLTAGQVLNNKPDPTDYRPNTVVWAYDDGHNSVSDIGHGSVTVNSNFGNGDTAPRFDVTLQFTPTSEFLSDAANPNFILQFASATCANDVISSAPEPASLGLFGGGLLALGLFGRRRLTAKA